MKDFNDFSTQEFEYKNPDTKTYDELPLKVNKKQAPQKHSRKKFLAQCVVFLVVVAVVIGTIFYSSIFKVQTIAISGNHYVTDEDICRIADIYKNRHMLQVDTMTASQTLMKDLRIKKATVRRIFPNKIVIEIVERRPVANIACDYGYVDLDKQGIVLQAYRTKHFQTFPFLKGVMLNEVYIGDEIQNAVVKNTLEFLSYLDDAALKQLTEIDLSNSQKVSVYTTKAVEIRLGELNRLEEKAKLTQGFLAKKDLDVEYFDLSFKVPYIKK